MKALIYIGAFFVLFAVALWWIDKNKPANRRSDMERQLLQQGFTQEQIDGLKRSAGY